MTTPTKREIINIPCDLTRAAHLALVQLAVRDARTDNPAQRGWICHQSSHYNTPGSRHVSASPCRCGHVACRPVALHLQFATLSFGDSSTTCFDVQVTTREDARHYGWVCFYCKVYNAWGALGDWGATRLVCAACGDVKEKEVVFVRKSLVGNAQSWKGVDGTQTNGPNGAAAGEHGIVG